MDIGLTREEVAAILGSAGRREEVPGAPPAAGSYYWENPDGSYINVGFEGGKVVSMQETGLKK